VNERYRLGYDVLGPVLAAFARLLLDQAKRDGVTRLAFIARDGHLLRDVTEALRLPETPALDFVHFSRISTSLAGQTFAVEEVASIRTGTLTVADLLTYYALGADDFDLAKHGLTRNSSIADCDGFLSDPSFVQQMRAARESQRQLLADYLRQHRLIDDPHTAFVDLGWRGSIPHALAQAFPDVRPMRCYNLAYWHELGCHPFPDGVMTGILSDCRNARTVTEGAAYYASILLEAICRAPHGTVLGYRREDDGTVVPVLAGDSPQRRTELAGEQWREPIRQGILDFAAQNGERYRDVTPGMRRAAQRLLFRLAFFPTGDEIEAVSGLAHTEGHVTSWSRPLIDAERPSPVFSPRRWLGGLTSPWRSGYVMATGGRVLASLFVVLESLLVAFPSLRKRLRKAALASARIPLTVS
jgi:hypothetical protein